MSEPQHVSNFVDEALAMCGIVDEKQCIIINAATRKPITIHIFDSVEAAENWCELQGILGDLHACRILIQTIN